VYGVREQTIACNKDVAYTFDLIINTPRSQLNGCSKDYAKKASTEVAKGSEKILIDIASEAVKKTLFPH